MKHLTFNDRIRIETMYNIGFSAQKIANELSVHYSTIYRELKRGIYDALTSNLIPIKKYSSEIAQKDYNYKSTSKGTDLKIANDYELVNFIENKIIDKYSPNAVLLYIKSHKLKFETSICKTTLYKYIDSGLFLNISNNNLIYGKRKKKSVKVIRHRKNILYENTIEARPFKYNVRDIFGHWEMDTVIGNRDGKHSCLLVLTERLTRQEIIVKIASKTSCAVVNGLNKLQKKYKSKFKQIFKTITCDNGAEFTDFNGIEKKGRTKIYYCHPYCSFERGSNENQNRFIRRFIPKGKNIDDFSNTDIKYIENWINNYPRDLHNGQCSNVIFKQYLQDLDIV